MLDSTGNHPPDIFYMASSEGYGLEEPRKCTPITRIRYDKRDDLLLVRIEPGIDGQELGLGDRTLDVVALATRHRGDSLFPIHQWPVCVHVARILTADIEQIDFLSGDDIEAIAWAELYPTEEAARRKGMSS
jgi:hypothetical protein